MGSLEHYLPGPDSGYEIWFTDGTIYIENVGKLLDSYHDAMRELYLTWRLHRQRMGPSFAQHWFYQIKSLALPLPTPTIFQARYCPQCWQLEHSAAYFKGFPWFIALFADLEELVFVATDSIVQTRHNRRRIDWEMAQAHSLRKIQDGVEFLEKSFAEQKRREARVEGAKG